MIGVRTQYDFTETKNAASAAFLIATTGGELVSLVKAGFMGNGSLCGNEQYAEVPNSWVKAVAEISATEGFKKAVADFFAGQSAQAKSAEKLRTKMNEANAEFSAINDMLKIDLAAAKVRYADAIAKFGDCVAHGYVASNIAALEYVAPVVTDLKAQVLAFLVSVEKANATQVAEKLSADEFQVSIKLAALVREKKATQDKRGFFYAV